MKPLLDVGTLCVISPKDHEHNPNLLDPSFIGMYLGTLKDASGWAMGKHQVLGPDGYVELWSNRWNVEPCLT